MLDNRAFWKALHSLTHPLSIAAILVLLFNDHWLRHNYPSLLTGKLGDFTWLLFAPFIAALLFACLIPQKLQKHTHYVGLASIAFIGIWFTTAKTVPFVHWMTTETLYAMLGYRGTLRMDATDLLTLPALLISWLIWRQAPETRFNLKPIAYVAFGLAMLGTMANSPAPHTYRTGIEIICELSNTNLITSTSSGTGYIFISPSPVDEIEFIPDTTFISRNGGTSWEQINTSENEGRCSSLDEQFAVDPNNNQIQYRWFQESHVEQSLDGGASWTQIHSLIELKQDVREYGNQRQNDNRTTVLYHLSPVSGLVHSSTGNLVLAMSRGGVLVIEPNGDSYWSSVGEFHLDDLGDKSLFRAAMTAQEYMLPTLWTLVLVTTVVIVHSHWMLIKIWTTIGWLIWSYLVISAHTAYTPYVTYDKPQPILRIWYVVAMGSFLLIILPMMLWALSNLFLHYRRAFVPIFVSVLLASLAYMLPLLLWTQGTIPRYFVAAIFSILLTGCVLWACYQYYKDKLPARYEPPKTKRKPKEA